MDLQTVFYTLGVVYFSVFLILTLAVGGMALSVYLKYRRIYLKTKRGVEKLKQAVPVVSYIFAKLNERKKQKERASE